MVSGPECQQAARSPFTASCPCLPVLLSFPWSCCMNECRRDMLAQIYIRCCPDLHPGNFVQICMVKSEDCWKHPLAHGFHTAGPAGSHCEWRNIRIGLFACSAASPLFDCEARCGLRLALGRSNTLILRESLFKSNPSSASQTPLLSGCFFAGTKPNSQGKRNS